MKYHLFLPFFVLSSLVLWQIDNGILFTFQVNDKFAIDLVHEEPPTEVDGRNVWCDGGGGALGHPKVYINLVSNLLLCHK